MIMSIIIWDRNIPSYKIDLPDTSKIYINMHDS